MLALVKKPHIELSIQGERVGDLVAWIKRRFDVSVLSDADADDSIPIEDTEFWKEMQSNRVGNLLCGFRLKAGLTQAELARRLRIRQSMISEYEKGKRSLSAAMAKRFCTILHIREQHLLPETHTAREPSASRQARAAAAARE